MTFQILLIIWIILHFVKKNEVKVVNTEHREVCGIFISLSQKKHKLIFFILHSVKEVYWSSIVSRGVAMHSAV